MKRNSYIVLVLSLLAMVLIAFAGCGGDTGEGTSGGSSQPPAEASGSENNNDSAGNEVKIEWPANKFPAGFPAYPNGTIEEVIPGDADVLIWISNTDKRTVDSYVESLTGAGWLLDDTDPGMLIMNKDGWVVMLRYEDGIGVTLSAVEVEAI